MDQVEENVMKILGVNKVKYDILDGIIDDRLKGKKTVHVHIDLNSIIKPLFDTQMNESFMNHDLRYHISSSILNIIAHYRAYFVYRHKLNSVFHLYYTDQKLSNGCDYFKQFKSVEFKEATYNMINSLDIVRIITMYCNNVYYLRTGDLDPAVCAAYYIDKFANDDISNIVLSKDDMYYQLVNVKNSMIIRLKRDDSVLLDKGNIFDFITRKSKYEIQHVSSELLSLYMTYAGVPTRDIKYITRTRVKILKLLDKMIENKDIINSYYPKIQYLLDGTQLPNQNEVIENFYKIDITTLYKKISKSDRIKLMDSLVNKFSRSDLRDLNVKYYSSETAIMLEELTLEHRERTKIKW